MTILFIGPFPPPNGGIAYQHKLLYEYSCKHSRLYSVSFDTCDLRRAKSIGQLYCSLSLLLRKFFSSDVIVLTCSSLAVPSVGLFISLLAKLLFKKCVIRKGGGVNPFNDLSPLANFLSFLALNLCDIFSVQTQSLYHSCSRLSPKVLHSRNIRDVDRHLVDVTRISDTNRICSKFVFVGHVKKAKGVDCILQLDSLLPPGVSIDVYGPCCFDITLDKFQHCSSIVYKGEFNQDKLLEKLSNGYDCLLLPTHHSGEGIPGVLIEALQLGIPVICTNWNSLPELVTSDVGLLIESPATADNLLGAINELHADPVRFASMRVSCIKKGNHYRPVNALQEFLCSLERLDS